MKSGEEIMEILEAWDLTGSYRDAGELAGVSHHTVARYVAARDAGRLVAESATRPQLIDEFLAKVEEWVDASKGKIRADVAHEKLLALGSPGPSGPPAARSRRCARTTGWATPGCTGRG